LLTIFHILALAHPNYNTRSPAFIKSDDITFDEKTSEVTANGSVEVRQAGYLLYADKIIYNQRAQTVEAIGRVSLFEPGGNVLYGDKIYLQQQMKTGVIEHFKARLKDNALLFASLATRINPKLTTLENAAYSPCPVCAGHKPQWQITANKVVLDEEAQQLTYKHSFFKIYGVPVLYLPYFSHAAPNSPSKSGVLAPKIGFSKIIGNSITVPLYINLSHSQELIVSPTVTSKKGTTLALEYNHLLKNGKYNFEGTLMRDQDYAPRRLRFDVKARGSFALTRYLGLGFDINRASDRSYLKNYQLNDADYLTTMIFSDYQKNRNNLSLEYVGFQRLRADKPGDTDIPHILPLVNLHVESDKLKDNSKFAVDSNIMMLYREHGTAAKRVSTKFSWNKPYISASGHHWNFITSLRSDLYQVQKFDSPKGKWSGVVSRVIPELQVDWKFPLIKPSADYNVMIEPQISSFISPTGGNRWQIPREDSNYTEISDINLFKSSHSTGLDLVETGTRVNYGLKTSCYAHSGYNVSMLVGQSYRFIRDRHLGPNSGMMNNYSDIVSRVVVQPSEHLDLYYKARFDKNDFRLRRNEIGSIIHLSPLSFDISYVSFDQYLADKDVKYPKELSVIAMVDLSKKWQFKTEARKNLSKYTPSAGRAKNFTYFGASVIYYGDCINVSASFKRDFTKDYAIKKKPNSILLFSIDLKGIS
jgi:LPS-assembly protein